MGKSYIDKSASLPPETLYIVRDKGTEPPFSGAYEDNEYRGTYLCRTCGLALFRASSQFASGCGWPSFDLEIEGAVKQQADSDGMRTEILCQRCSSHLGHVFQGEGFTPLDTRHCVNSSSLDFVDDLAVKDSEEAIFAAGCFWGVDYYFKRLGGVLKVEVGYCGGKIMSPTYEQVCSGKSGHFEAVRVLYDPSKVSYEEIAQYFFEIHDPTQNDGQGPDIGKQYLSCAFYYNEEQRKTIISLIEQLKAKGYDIATAVLPVSTFWPAEGYHQDYYQKTGKSPYCHNYTKRF